MGFHEAVESLGAEGGGRGEYADAPRAAALGGWFDRRLEAHDGNGITLAQRLEGGPGGGVAGDDHQLRPALDQFSDHVERALPDLVEGSAAVRAEGVVG